MPDVMMTEFRYRQQRVSVNVNHSQTNQYAVADMVAEIII